MNCQHTDTYYPCRWCALAMALETSAFYTALLRCDTATLLRIVSTLKGNQ